MLILIDLFVAWIGAMFFAQTWFIL